VIPNDESKGITTTATNFSQAQPSLADPTPSSPDQETCNALREFRDWNPTSQISQFVEELNYVPGGPPSPHVPKRLAEEAETGVEDQDSGLGKVVGEWRARFQMDPHQNLDYEHQEMSVVHEVST